MQKALKTILFKESHEIRTVNRYRTIYEFVTRTGSLVKWSMTSQNLSDFENRGRKRIEKPMLASFV